ncbi:hypothetical protein LSTR_LSTR000647 [Laodelphax striatellus]|uniref:Odorant receptor n=1 Tax=Laodelphax striatellus TaxID=195883 RepID=A0A482XF81_LAOST|nr:hypothetical protein LSTR_LSTR000647 [Laodelphax striatellus]
MDIKETKEMSNTIGRFLSYLQSTGLHSTEKFILKGKISFFILFIAVLEIIVATAFCWKQWDINVRVTALENLNMAIGILDIAIESQLMREKIESQLELISSGVYLYNLALDGIKVSIFKEKENYVRGLETKIISLTEIIETSMHWFFIGYFMSSFCGIIVYLFNQDLNALTLPIVFYNPFSHSPSVPFVDFKEYCIVLSIELWYFYVSYKVTLSMGGFLFLSVDNVIREIKLFQMNLHELNLNFNAVETGDKYSPQDYERFDKFKPVFRKICEHHQRIFRKVKMLNEGIDFIVICYNPYICFQLCLAIFCIMKVDFLFKIKYGFAFITVLVIAFKYCELGQELENEGEKLRMSLYNSSWAGKPSWFGRSLLIMMIQSHRIPRIEAFRIITLNRINLRLFIGELSGVRSNKEGNSVHRNSFSNDIRRSILAVLHHPSIFPEE